MKILITPRSFAGAGKEAIKLLEEKGFEVLLNTTGKSYTEEQMVELCSDVDGVIVGVDPVSEKVLRNAKNLKAISKYGAGLDNIDLETTKELGIQVDRAAGTNATSVAELAVGLFFSLARSIPSVARDVKSGGWGRVKGVELTGKTVGIIGLGNIGKEVARMCYGIGMKILGYDPYVSSQDEYISRYSIELDEMADVISGSDFVTLHLPLTEETKHMINETALKSMKPGAFLVNTSRGGLTDEEALYEALAEGVIAGAAQDVFSKEPPGEHKLLTLDNFILTSHIGAYTKEANEKMAAKSTENLIRMLGVI